MRSTKEILNQIINNQPDIIQFAKDRKYEESWIISIKDTPPSKNTINKYLQSEVFNTLIVEYVWNSNDDNNRFVLTLFLDERCTLKDPAVFVEICLSLFYSYQDFISFIDTIDNQIVGTRYLLQNPVDSINLGVFNHWVSIGPVELWNNGETYNLNEIVKKIQSRPEVEKTTLNYQGLLFRFNTLGNLNGPYYGIKAPCCNKVNNEWIVDFNKIDKWIKIILGINPLKA